MTNTKNESINYLVLVVIHRSRHSLLRTWVLITYWIFPDVAGTTHCDDKKFSFGKSFILIFCKCYQHFSNSL